MGWLTKLRVLHLYRAELKRWIGWFSFIFMSFPILGFQSCERPYELEIEPGQSLSSEVERPSDGSTTAPALPSQPGDSDVNLPPGRNPDNGYVPLASRLCGDIQSDTGTSEAGGGGLACVDSYAYSTQSPQQCEWPSEVSGPGASNGFIYAFGVYESIEDQGSVSSSRPILEINVHVADSKSPGSVVLLLSSYEPAIWHITGNTEAINKVYLLGYHCQDAYGVPWQQVEAFSYDQGGWDAVPKGIFNDDLYMDSTSDLIRGVACDPSQDVAKRQFVYTADCVGRQFTVD